MWFIYYSDLRGKSEILQIDIRRLFKIPLGFVKMNEKEMARQIQKADEMLKNGRVDDGIKLYDSVARFLEKQGMEKEAQQIYLRGGTALVQLKEWEPAIEMFEKAKAPAETRVALYSQAALATSDFKLRKEYGTKASQLYEELGDKYHQMGEKMRVVALGGLEEKMDKRETLKKAAAVLIFLGGLLGILGISFQYTGMVVADNASKISAFGALFFVLGACAFMLFFKRKN